MGGGRALGGFHPFTGRDLPWLVDAQAARFGDKPFLVWEPFDGARRVWSYAAFAEETRAYAAGLAAHGVGQGDFVVIHLENCPEFLFAWYACSRLGAVAVTTNTRSAPDELAYFLDHSRAVAAITEPRYLEAVRAAGTALRWIACTGPEQAGALAFDALHGDPDAVPQRPADPHLPNSVQYTSGTTSRPKGVVWTHANALWSGKVTAAHARLTPDDVNLFFFPLFHTNATAYSVLATLWSGGTAVMMPKFSASRFWDVALRNGCTWANMVMFTIRALETQPAPEHNPFRLWAYFGGDVAAVRERWGLRTLGWYGMTETVSQCAVCDLDFPLPEGSMGWPAPEYELSLRREDGSEAAVGELARLWIRGVRGLSLFQEYLNDAAATVAAFDDDGWFDTGDEVRAAASGHLFFVGRAKDMLKVGAENVAALEIEAVINRVPGVVECAVVGKPDPMLDEVPVAFVVADDAGGDLEAAIRDACAAGLADFKRPREIHFCDALPKGLLDKTLKAELRARLRAE